MDSEGQIHCRIVRGGYFAVGRFCGHSISFCEGSSVAGSLGADGK